MSNFNDSILWTPDFDSLTKFIPSAKFLVIRWWNSVFNHFILFHFTRPTGSKLLKCTNIIDECIFDAKDLTYGKLKVNPWKVYIPYPRDLTLIIEEVYGKSRTEGGYFTYDPVSTLGAFKAICDIETNAEGRDIIRRKLLADLTLQENCPIVCEEMKTTALREWIVNNTVDIA